jgi:hypothetical protein
MFVYERFISPLSRLPGPKVTISIEPYLAQMSGMLTDRATGCLVSSPQFKRKSLAYPSSGGPANIETI